MAKRRKQRRRRGEGLSRQTAAGTWQALVPSGQTDAKNRTVYRSLGTYPTEKAADEARWKHHLAGREPMAVTLGDWLDTWLADHKSRHRPATVDRDRQAIDTHVRPHLATVPLGQLDAARITTWLTGLDASPSEKGKAWAALRKCLRSNPAIPYSQIERVRSPTVRREKKRSLTWEQYRHLCGTADGWRPRWYPYAGALVRVAVECCTRPGELLGLRVSDYQDGIISIEQAWSQSARSVGPLKNEWSRRRVPLSPEGRGAVDAWLKKHPGGEPLFPNRLGGYHDYHNFVPRFWVRLRAAAGLPDRFGMHELRHTGISLLMAAGCNILEVARRAGHRDGSLILKVYGHVMPHGQERLTSVFANSTNTARSGEVGTVGNDGSY